jgi:hypothetical protein
MSETRGPQSALTSITLPVDETGDRSDDERQVGSAPERSDRLSWRSVGAGAASLATPVGIGVLHPVLGEVVAVIEVAVVLIIIGTALFGSPALSDRAFRLLRWIRNQPEPQAPVSSDMHERHCRTPGSSTPASSSASPAPAADLAEPPAGAGVQ